MSGTDTLALGKINGGILAAGFSFDWAVVSVTGMGASPMVTFSVGKIAGGKPAPTVAFSLGNISGGNLASGSTVSFESNGSAVTGKKEQKLFYCRGIVLLPKSVRK